MSTITVAAALRRFWAPGVNEVTGNPSALGIRNWISNKGFQVYAPLSYPFRLHYADKVALSASFAGEAMRMSLAAMESLASIRAVPELPKSKAWALVQWYYGAFYAAHALLRMTGRSLLHLETGHAKAIDEVASHYGQSGSARSGFHLVVLDASTDTVEFACMNGAHGGSHEFMWRAFDQWLKTCSDELLRTPGGSSEIQAAAMELDELRSILGSDHADAGCWLSSVRNRVNYRHELASWFPYAGHDTRDLAVFSSSVPSKAPPALKASPVGRPIQRFLDGCRFIVGLCWHMSVEMDSRCPTGRSHV